MVGEGQQWLHRSAGSLGGALLLGGHARELPPHTETHPMAGRSCLGCSSCSRQTLPSRGLWAELSVPLSSGRADPLGWLRGGCGRLGT